MKAIAYSLFGYGRITPATCFEFESYARGFFVNCRINRVIYPGYTTVLNIDQESFDSPYKEIFEWLRDRIGVVIVIQPNNEHLCRAMLWRFKTVFTYNHPEWAYTHVLCRDTDSIGTYREAQAVTQWIHEDRAAHCITDSISHNIPMMGGMCGFRPGYLNDRIKITRDPGYAQEAVFNNTGIDFTKKGSDQDYLMKFIYPKVAHDSVTSHFVLGMKHVTPEGEGTHYKIDDIEIGVDPIHKFLNTCAGHIGASGYYEPPMLKWLNTIDPFKEEYETIQKKFPKVFFWG